MAKYIRKQIPEQLLIKIVVHVKTEQSMKREELLNMIASKGYDISYSANRNFATYDIIKKYPKFVSIITIMLGIVGLAYPETNFKCLSVVLLILGIITLYVENYGEHADEYGQRGVDDTDRANRLNSLYYRVKDEGTDCDQASKEFDAIVKEFNDASQPNQICFSDWYAHYKLFCQKDYRWMDEQLHFGTWKDKTPASFKALLYTVAGCALIVFIVWAVKNLIPFLTIAM